MFWRRKPKFGDAEKEQVVRAICAPLELQKVMASGYSIETAEGKLNRKAIGYIYGFIDAALTSIGQDMSDASLSMPIVYQVLRHLFPGREERYTQFLLENVGKDDVLRLGMMKGGQQFVDYSKPGSKGTPMGLARYMMKGEAQD
ncbi:MAG TPA: hypothetical protein VMU06_12990 [Stellaceae bacterium]|nr:hypothetical protein [Stellaceae bacterium]